MKKICVLAEKPSVGRDIARVLGCSKSGGAFFEGEKYIVTWALGHLVTLADPEAYDSGYKTWQIDQLPILPEKLELVVIRQTQKQYQQVKQLLRRSDVEEIVIATDAGREGELVARWILEKANVQKKIRRLWISSVTDKAIKEGFARLQNGADYQALYQSAAARAAADWYVGINATRALTCKFNAQLSCGRVQTPTLAMVAARDQEIQNFVPEEYYGLQVQAGNIAFTWKDLKSKSYRSFDFERMQALQKKLQGQPVTIVSAQKKEKKIMPPHLYNLTELQRDANRMFEFSAKETLSIMQKLYEQHKILTYPRTDSQYLSDDIVPTLKERLQACGTGPYTKMAFAASRQIRAAAHFVDNKKVSDHHAIIPTEQYVNLSALTDRERKIYDLVVRRFIAVFFPPTAYEQVSVEAVCAGESLAAQGKIIKDEGWKAVYHLQEEADEQEELLEQKLPDLHTGDVLSAAACTLSKKTTQPPKPFTEGTLLGAMENPVRYMGNESRELKKVLGESGGLGTVATRADIIEKLFSTFLFEKKGKYIYITAKGRQLLELVPTDLKEPALTARWEEQLSAIAAGKANAQAFVKEICGYAGSLVSEIKNSEGKFRHDNLTRKKCPDCGKFLLEVNGKHGKMLVCQDRSCGYKKSLAVTTNARCPECHKKMELRGEGDHKSFYCVCGYREQLKAFQKRKEKNNDRPSKRDVAQFMQKQEDVPVNTALADALAKLKLK